MSVSHGIDDYLETIYFLAFPIGEYTPSSGNLPLASRVAEMLGVSRASAGEMLKRLEAEGLIERGEHKEALLTPAGRTRAERVVRKHRIIERLLTDFMGYTPGEAHVQADELGDTFNDDMIERIERSSAIQTAVRTAGRSIPSSSRPRTESSPRCRISGRETAPRSCGSRSTTATCSTGSTTKVSCRAARSRSATPNPRRGS